MEVVKVVLFEVEEECSCGGKVKVGGVDNYGVTRQVEVWRDTHQCYNRSVSEVANNG